jgi:hypothetical protein
MRPALFGWFAIPLLVGVVAISSTAHADSSLPRGANAAVAGNFAEQCRAHFQEARRIVGAVDPDVANDRVLVTIEVVTDPRGSTAVFLTDADHAYASDARAQLVVVGKNVAPKMTREGLLAQWKGSPSQTSLKLQVDGSWWGEIQVHEGTTPKEKAFVDAFQKAIDRCLGRDVNPPQRR